MISSNAYSRSFRSFVRRPDDFIIFQSGNRVLAYDQEYCSIYILGQSLDEEYRAFELIKQFGWGRSPFCHQTGEVEVDCINLGDQTAMITKAPAEHKTVQELCEAINRTIEEHPSIRPYVKLAAMENARNEINRIPDLSGVQSIIIFVYPTGMVTTHLFRRGDDVCLLKAVQAQYSTSSLDVAL